jgi:hypothetical protein
MAARAVRRRAHRTPGPLRERLAAAERLSPSVRQHPQREPSACARRRDDPRGRPAHRHTAPARTLSLGITSIPLQRTDSTEIIETLQRAYLAPAGKPPWRALRREARPDRWLAPWVLLTIFGAHGLQILEFAAVAPNLSGTIDTP